MDKDHLNGLPPHQAVETAYAMVSAIQSQPAAAQVAGVATLFVTICDTLKLDPSELINKAQRMSRDDDTFFRREMKALRDYITGELR